MNASKQNIASIFNGHTIFDVPFYQRSYVWKEDQWYRFIEDMQFVSKTRQDYFLGSIIIKQQSTNLGDFDHRTIIDGQQRFTTLALFLKVLCLKTNDADTFNHHFLVRNKKKCLQKFAISHSLNDKKDFERVMSLSEATKLDDNKPSNIVRAYNYFCDNINKDLLDTDELLSHLVFVGIDLQQEDDEQAIFDTINSLGVRLTTGELLKNYFFNEGSKEEYEQLWLPTFESDKSVIEYWNSIITTGRLRKTNIDTFFYSYLNIKIQDKNIAVDSEHKLRYRRADSIFANYKDFIATYKLDKEEFIWDIVDYAQIYHNNFCADISKTELPCNPSIERINFIIYVLDCSTLIPYILYLLKNAGSEDELKAIFEYLETYIVRRVLSKSNNNNFSDLFTENLIGNNICTLQGLRDYIENKDESQTLAMPTDAKVRESIKEVDHPNKRALAILYLMESRLRYNQPHATKLYSFDGYSLEHLMPKKWQKNWPLIEGYDSEERNQKISTLGNLAMLPSKLNSAISNASWSIKKAGKNNHDGIVAYASDLITLKTAIAQDSWNEHKIEDRSNWLADIAINIWPSYLPDADVKGLDELGIYSKTIFQPSPKKESTKRNNSSHDNTKYSLNDSLYMSKSDFVFAIVKQYVKDNSGLTYGEIKAKFHDGLCSSGFKFIGLLCTEGEYNAWNNKNKEKRYQPNRNNRRLISSDGIVFYVNTQWTQEAMPPIVDIAKKEGWTVTMR